MEFQLQQMKQRLTKEQENRQSAEGNARILKRKSRHSSQELLQFPEKAEKRQVLKETIPTVELKRVLKNRRYQKMAKRTRGAAKKEMETFIKEVMDNSEFTEEQSDYL